MQKERSFDVRIFIATLQKNMECRAFRATRTWRKARHSRL